MHRQVRWTIMLLAGWGMFCAYPYAGMAPPFVATSRYVPTRSGGGVTLMVRPPLDSGGLDLKGMRYAYPVSRGWAEGGLLLYSKREDGLASDVLQAMVARAWLVPFGASPHRRYAFLRVGALLELDGGGVSAFALRPPLRPALEMGLIVTVDPRNWVHLQLVPPVLAWTYVLPDRHFTLTGGVEGYCTHALWATWGAPLCPAVRWRVVAGLSFLLPGVPARSPVGDEP